MTLPGGAAASTEGAPGVSLHAHDGAGGPWSGLLDSLQQATWIVELQRQTVVAVNRQALAMLGLAESAVLGQRAERLLPTPEDLAYWRDADPAAPDRLWSDTVLCTADGRVLHVERSIVPIARPQPGRPSAPHELHAPPGLPQPAEPRYAVVSLRDRTAQQAAEDASDELVTQLQATLESTTDGILVTDLAGAVQAFNRRFSELWALPESLVQGRDATAIRDWMRRAVVDRRAFDRTPGGAGQTTMLPCTDQLQLLSGQVFERVTTPLWSRGRSRGRIDVYRDLSERIAAAQRIEELSLTDALTGLPNRRQLAARVVEAALQSRSAGRGFALLLVDLDRFRQVNNSLGHDTGDHALLEVAQRIQRCMRTHDLLASVGGDQFAVLLHESDAAAAAATARRLLKVVAQPYNIDGAQFTLTCSIGVALCPLHGKTVDDLTRQAETAMRAVKSGGRGHYRFHQKSAEVDLRSHMTFDHAMRQALVSGRFRLHYQPQLRLADGALVGAEALIRWRDPELGDVSPAQFIPVAEDSGFIVPIGDWVLSQAVRQATLWYESGRETTVAINVSALQFQQPQFIDRVASVLAVSGLPPHLLELELTESILVHHAEEALQRLHALARLGVRLSIDDFGTGYSSLSYLKRFPIGKLKIDRSFVQGLPGDESDAGIVRAVLQMARALGKQVIAEGVETELQREFLRNEGCDEFQGFLYAPALDALTFESHLPPPRPGSPPPAVPPVPVPVPPAIGEPRIRLVR